MPSEMTYKRDFRASYGGWSAAIEPGRGGDTGAADLLVLVGQRIVPIELKLGHMQDNGFVAFHNPGIRASQVQWHWSLAQAGGFSLLAAGEWDCGTKAWTTHVFGAHDLSYWRNGLLPLWSGPMEALYRCLWSQVRVRFDHPLNE